MENKKICLPRKVGEVVQQQMGVVVASDAGTAQVRIVQHSACAHCGKCHMSHEQRSLIVSAQNLVAAQPGDRVVLSLSERAVLQAGLLAYALPLIAMFLGAFLGQYYGGQTGALVGGFGALVVSYVLLHYVLEPRLQRGPKFSLNITRIIDDEEANSCVTEHDNSHY